MELMLAATVKGLSLFWEAGDDGSLDKTITDGSPSLFWEAGRWASTVETEGRGGMGQTRILFGF